jgi:small subunit ribosomal protein S19
MKNNFFNPYIDKKIDRVNLICKERGLSQTQVLIKIWSRGSTIQDNHIGYHFQIHNGKTYKKLIVTKDMVGKKFGEFAPTRKFNTHKKKKNN